MNWTQLRPLLREQYGNKFGFYNDKYRSGKRRIKIRCNGVNQSVMKQFILEQDSSLEMYDYDFIPFIGNGAMNYRANCIVIYFND